VHTISRHEFLYCSVYNPAYPDVIPAGVPDIGPYATITISNCNEKWMLPLASNWALAGHAGLLAFDIIISRNKILVFATDPKVSINCIKLSLFLAVV
jgi:hypothetical protein